MRLSSVIRDGLGPRQMRPESLAFVAMLLILQEQFQLLIDNSYSKVLQGLCCFMNLRCLQPDLFGGVTSTAVQGMEHAFPATRSSIPTLLAGAQGNRGVRANPSGGGHAGTARQHAERAILVECS